MASHPVAVEPAASRLVSSPIGRLAYTGASFFTGLLAALLSLMTGTCLLMVSQRRRDGFRR